MEMACISARIARSAAPSTRCGTSSTTTMMRPHCRLLRDDVGQLGGEVLLVLGAGRTAYPVPVARELRAATAEVEEPDVGVPPLHCGDQRTHRVGLPGLRRAGDDEEADGVEAPRAEDVLGDAEDRLAVDLGRHLRAVDARRQCTDLGAPRARPAGAGRPSARRGPWSARRRWPCRRGRPSAPRPCRPRPSRAPTRRSARPSARRAACTGSDPPGAARRDGRCWPPQQSGQHLHGRR